MRLFSGLLRFTSAKSSRKRRRTLLIETLQDRLTPAVTAAFSPAAGLLTVFGDASDNTITVSRNAAGTLLVNHGAVAIAGGPATVTNTAKIEVYGLSGNDIITLNEANGALPAANLFGGNGNDRLTGGSGNDMLYGQRGHDTLLGKGGADFMLGGGENDVLIGGDGDDLVFGQWGNDRLVWNHGDGTDLNEGGTGIDTVEVNGSNLTETFTIIPNGTRVRFDRIDPTPFSLDIGTSENLVLNANAGFDVVTAINGLGGLIHLTIDGGAGNDTIVGGNGNDILLGGDGNDVIRGGLGDDVVLMGAGNDTFHWNPGDGSDVVEGQAGDDRMVFNGSNANETIDISANGERVRFFRNVGNVTMDLDDVEEIDFNALGGADIIVVNDLTGTDAPAINLNLASSTGSGDAQVDTVIINGTFDDDVIAIATTSSGVEVFKLAARVTLRNAESTDKLIVNGLAGDDVIDATLLQAASLLFNADGGDDDDIIFGGAGDDTLFGGAGDDVLIGNAGNDILDGGEGDNVVIQ